MPPGEYSLGPVETGALFTSNGRVGYQAAEGCLASSVVGIDVMVKNMSEMSGATLYETVRMASLTPAERVGMDREIGSLESGKFADVLVLDRNLAVRRVFIAGEECARAPSESAARV